ncbi:Cas4 family exonuclease [Microbacterium phage Phinky]|nr:Cas4 family exonuclease [Microbacterium phage Phinky]
MAAENIGSPEILRDTALEQRLLEAVIADRNAQPRSQQLQIGPSEVGGCRELLRAGLFEPPQEAEPETNWAAAAHVGQVMGADLERIFGERVNALLQQRYTTMFGMFGISISGGADLTFLDGDQISDLKSIEDMGSTLYDLKRDAAAIETLLSIYREGLLFAKNIETPDGGYELTQAVLDGLAKLSNYVQIAIYVMGAMQAGIISENGSGRLVFYDRSGNYQGFVAVVIPTEWIWMFYQIGQMRIGQVVQVQSAFEEVGQRAILATLRDKTPSFCFSTKVMCPRRVHCWGGSEYTPEEGITNQEHIDAANRYEVGRDLAKLADGMKKTGKDVLKADDVQGTLPDGRKLSFTRSGAINLVSTTVTEPKTQAVLDQFMPPVDILAEVAQREAAKARAAAAPAPQVDTNPPAVDTSEPQVDTEQPEVHAEGAEAVTPTLTREQRYKALETTAAPIVRRMAHDLTGIELKGLLKGDAIDAILNHEYPKAPSEADDPVRAAASEGDVTRPGEQSPLAEAGPVDQDYPGDPEAQRNQLIQDVAATMTAEQVRELNRFAADMPRAVDSDSADWDAVRPEEEVQTEQPVNPGLGRVVFEPAYSEQQQVYNPTPEQEEARAKLMRGPHVAPLLDTPRPPEVVHAKADEVLPNEDPERPGLFLYGMEGKDRLRRMQYDSDPAFRERLLAVRVKFNGNTPSTQQ